MSEGEGEEEGEKGEGDARRSYVVGYKKEEVRESMGYIHAGAADIIQR